MKRKLYKYFSKKRTHRYVNVLQDMVQSYNATPHKSLNYVAPKDVNTKNEADIWAHMYMKPKTSGKGVKPYHFKIGDMVRISHNYMVFDRAYNEHFTKEIFKVRRFRMQGIPMYRLKDFLDDNIKGNFYESEMQKVSTKEDSLWFIEKKLRKRKRNGRVEWLIKFDGWPDKYNQWIPEDDISDTTES